MKQIVSIFTILSDRKLLCSFSILCVLFLCGCTGGNGNRITSGNEITPMPPQKETQEATSSGLEGQQSITAALIGLDSEKMQMIVKDIYSGDNYVLSYNGGTDVKNVYDEVVTMMQVPEGELLDITFDEEKKKARTVYVCKDAFRTSRVIGFKATVATSTITFGSASYMYTDTLVVLSDGKILTPAEIMSRDQVTVRGIDNKIYSVSVDKGHGYLTFSGAEDFVGGMVEIGRSFLYTVSSDMMIVVPEGEYEVVMSNGELEGKKTVYITKDMTVTLDFSEYSAPASKTGTVEFQILPKDADLFIEGNKTDYSKPVVLEYGTYIINLLSNNYDTYTTKITVNSTYQVEAFDLEKIYAKENQTTPVSTTAATTAQPVTTVKPTTTAAPTTSQTPSQTTPTAAPAAGEVALTIAEPAGANVYVDNVYVGTAPVTINKSMGEYVITFKRDGYITKSYIVDVDSSDGAQSLSFPAMSEE